MEDTATPDDGYNDADELALCRVVYEIGRPNSRTVSLCQRCNGRYDRCVWYLDGK